MTSIVTGSLVFACLFGATLLAMWLRSALPNHHLSGESKESVRLAMGLVATMAALLLGLLVASAKSSYDAEKNEVTQMAAKIAFLDRVLAKCGPESAATREALRRVMEQIVDCIWPDGKSQHAELDPSASAAKAEALYDSIQKLPSQTDEQRTLKSQALGTAIEVGQARWRLFEQAGRSISTPFLVVVVFWLAIIFFSFGLFAPRNTTVVTAILLAALSVSGAIFLILELDQPFEGLIQISGETMRNVLGHLRQ
jgi:hypothetical protein